MEVRGKHGGDSCKKSLTSVVCCAIMVPSFASHCLRITLTTGGRPFLVNDIHRTPCAGVVAACGNSNAGVTGIAYRCRILPIKVWGSPNLPPLSDVADAIRYAGARAAVLSNSWTCSTSDVVRQAIQDMIGGGCGSLGTLVSFAAGNSSGAVGFPARLDASIAVGASTHQAQRAGYSCCGPELDLVAPSSGGTQSIWTTDVSTANRG